MKKLFSLLLITALLSSCAVEHFNVNTTNSGSGWRVFGEHTPKGTFKRDYDIMIIGINVSQADTKVMAEALKASSYTIESKYNLVTLFLNYFTGGLVSVRTVKVIKR